MKLRWLAAASLVFAIALGAQSKPVVAVMYFDSPTKDDAFPFLQKALSEMLVVDLSEVEGLDVVEREGLEKIVAELELGLSGLVDEATAPDVGAMLGARQIITGTIFFLRDSITVSFKITDTETAKLLKAGKAAGKRDDVLGLQAALSASVQAALKELSPAIILKPPAAKAKTVGIDEVAQYGRALDAKDRKDLEEAARLLEDLLKSAPSLSYALRELDAAKARIASYNAARLDTIKDLGKGAVTWEVFYGSLMSHSVSYNWQALLDYCVSVEDALPRAPAGFSFSAEELLLYYKFYALAMLARHEEAVALGEAFLKRFPLSTFFGSVKAFLSISVAALEQKAKNALDSDPVAKDYLAKIAKAKPGLERATLQHTLAKHYSSKQLYKEAVALLESIDLNEFDKGYLKGDYVLSDLVLNYYLIGDGPKARETLKRMKDAYPGSALIAGAQSMVAFLP
jgi:TolB-like protein